MTSSLAAARGRPSAPPEAGFESGEYVVVMRRRETDKRVEQVGVGSDQDSCLALLHAAEMISAALSGSVMVIAANA
jgi:hypothetical protein